MPPLEKLIPCTGFEFTNNSPVVSDLFSPLLTVTELTGQIRLQLESGFPQVWVTGEISNLRCPSSGHRYFTLKDQASQIRAVLFRSQADRLKFSLIDGLEVVACGRLSVYEPRGDYQLLLEVVEPKGLGQRQLAFLQLKLQLEQEGIFELRRKKPLPPYPQKIGLVTSSTGAAIHDLLTVLQRRWPLAHLVILPVVVQGPEAVLQITQAIQTLNTLSEVEVMIVGRGGGSIEDLWAFNEEPVVRAIADSKIPVISAVGHETDVTLADFASDCRAPTPSVAAELAVPDWELVVRRIQQNHGRLTRTMQALLSQASLHIHRLEQRLPEPRLILRRHSQRVDELEGQMIDCFVQRCRTLRFQVLEYQGVVWEHNPKAGIMRWHDHLDSLALQVQDSMRQYLKDHDQRIQTLGLLLHQLSPLAVLGRGYSLAQRARDGKILKNAQEVSCGEMIRVTLNQGHLACQVNQVERS